MKTVLIFGATGGIGSAITQLLLQTHTVITVSRQQLDLAGSLTNQQYTDMQSVLSHINPDVVINCAGVFAGSFAEVFTVNVGCNWQIIEYYTRYLSIKPVQLILVGSSAYHSGRKNYPLYAASKAALHNLVQGAQEIFAGTQISLSLLHPTRVNTKMSQQWTSAQHWLTADQVAAQILAMCNNSSIINEMRYNI
jgi:2-C-methyl-D-erythritol 4-phosphate cytidylyltransferase